MPLRPLYLPAVLVVLMGTTGMAGAQQVSSKIFVGRSGGADGVVLSDFASRDASALLIDGTARGTVEPRRTTRGGRSPDGVATYHGLVSRVAQQTGVSERLLHAVISAESDYAALAVSPKGAMGLMQLMPATARRFGAVDAFRPEDNVRAGALYLKWLLELFDGDVPLALAGYNAGENAVIRAGYRIPPYAETQLYVPRVLERMRSLPGH